jgi:hypothetical protein
LEYCICWGDSCLYPTLANKTTEDAINGLFKVNGAGVYSAVTDNSSNWNTAYGWGNHGSVGYSIISGLTPKYLPKAASSSTIGDSVIYEDTNRIGIYTVDVTKTLNVGGNYRGVPVTEPVHTGMAAALAGLGAGNVNNGIHYYSIVYVSSVGATGGGIAAYPSISVNVVDKTTNGQVSLTGIPVSSDVRVTSKKIYRSAAGGGQYGGYYLATITAAATTYVDNIADASLVTSNPYYRKTNTTAGIFYLGGTQNSIFLQATDAFHTSLGLAAGASNTTGNSWVAIGGSALQSNTTGSQSNALGYNALQTLTTGNSNNAFGYAALLGLTTGGSNSGFGDNALRSDSQINNNYNCAFGSSSLYGMYTGSNYNIGIGYAAGWVSTIAAFTGNTFIGSRILKEQFYSGNYNLKLGYSANLTNAVKSYQTMLGGDTTTETIVNGNTYIKNETSLGSEILTNPTLTSGTSWSRTNDCTLATDRVTWSYSAGTASSLTQTSATFASTPVGSRWYKFTYTVVSTTSTIGGVCYITTAFASENTYLYVTAAGTYTTYFRSTASPGNFIITATMTVGQSFALDTFSLKEVVGGDLNIGRNLDVVGTVNAIGGFKANGTAAIADGTYTVGYRLTAGGVDGTITTKGGIITAIQQAT